MKSRWILGVSDPGRGYAQTPFTHGSVWVPGFTDDLLPARDRKRARR